MSLWNEPTPPDIFWSRRRSSGASVCLRWFKGVVSGKKENPGVLWGTWYTLAVDFPELGVMSFTVSYAQYCQAQVGGQGQHLFESPDGNRWRQATGEYTRIPPENSCLLSSHF